MRLCLFQAEAREAGRKLLESERRLEETRAEEQAARARLEADMAAPKARPSSGRPRLRCAHYLTKITLRVAQRLQCARKE